MWAGTSSVALWMVFGLFSAPRVAAQFTGSATLKTVPAVKYVDPIRTLVSAFDRFNLIGLGERHHNLEDSRFRLTLIRDPEFAQKVNDIVIEFGNPRHQAVLDRFVSGDDVPRNELCKVWQDTTQRPSRVWSSPIYEDLIVVVRSVNFGLPPDKRLRVLAGDYPINWEPIDTENARPFPRLAVLGSLMQGIDRDAAAAMVIRKEVLDKNRRALVIFGGGHFRRDDPKDVLNLLHDDPRAKWLSVDSFGGAETPAVIAMHTATPDKPVLLTVSGAIGNLYAGYLDLDKNGWDTSPKRVKLRQIMDLLLYFGTTPPIQIPSPPISH